MQDWRAVLGAKSVSSERMTQEKLAFEAEIDLTYVGGIERGKRNPSLLVMARIAEALCVPITKLLSD
ncbi:DNA-binding protein [Bradyrhizobium sp. CCBAU 53415]|nr:DNA-binding protein [Bradyrhizobium sp. CCBAU 53415]